jgi:hypothetical protein
VRIPARKPGPLADLQAFTELPFELYVIGFFIIYWAVYFAFYYISIPTSLFRCVPNPFARSTFTATPTPLFSSLDSKNLLLLTIALGITGRILPGFVAARFPGPLNTAIPTAVSIAIVLYCWPAVVHAHSPLHVFAAVYGLVASAIQSLFAISLAALTADLSLLGARMGMMFSVVTFTSLTGSPFAGAIVQASGGSLVKLTRHIRCI